MADVQAVNIWTGAEWVEIAQPIADGGNVGDVLTWSGSEWAAAAPGGLPIGSEDGTVVLGSPVANTFTIHTGGTERVRVSKNGMTIPNNYQNETVGVYGIYSAINKSAKNAGGTFAFLAGGDAPSQFNGQLLVSSGGAATPSIANRSDPTTGFDIQPGVVMITTDGTERLRVDATGQITAADGYYPVADQDLATAKYVSDAIYTLTGARYTTADIRLANPTRSLGRFTPPADLDTQEDANQAIGDAIAERKIVLPISRVDYDALPVKDPDTLYLITS